MAYKHIFHLIWLVAVIFIVDHYQVQAAEEERVNYPISVSTSISEFPYKRYKLPMTMYFKKGEKLEMESEPSAFRSARTNYPPCSYATGGVLGKKKFVLEAFTISWKNQWSPPDYKIENVVVPEIEVSAVFFDSTYGNSKEATKHCGGVLSINFHLQILENGPDNQKFDNLCQIIKDSVADKPVSNTVGDWLEPFETILNAGSYFLYFNTNYGGDFDCVTTIILRIRSDVAYISRNQYDDCLTTDYPGYYAPTQPKNNTKVYNVISGLKTKDLCNLK